MKTLFICLLLVTTTLTASPIPQEEVNALSSGSWKLPSSIGLERIEKLLNKFVAQTYQKAFRYIGASEDFFHGHLLIEEVGAEHTLYPRAILYHTQEEAHAAHWNGNVAAKFDYLDVTTRNWIQWISDDGNIDGKAIENARVYLNHAKKDPKQFETNSAPQKELFYTIHSADLDPVKLGFRVYGDLQFEFNAADCNAGPENEYDLARGPIRVMVNGSEICMRVSTFNSILIK